MNTARSRRALWASLGTLIAAVWSVQGHASEAEMAAEANEAITWEQLLEAIPELRDMESRRVDDASTQRTEYRFCEKRPELGTRVARERCYTLEQLVHKYCRPTHSNGISQWCFELGN